MNSGTKKEAENMTLYELEDAIKTEVENLNYSQLYLIYRIMINIQK